MNRFFSYLLLTALIFLFPVSLTACDDTLVMLLTAKNPNSEFSKSIRKVATYLSNLGATLKAGMKKDYSVEMKNVMDAWLEFTMKYMTNPPEEARGDKNWAEKTRKTSEVIGQIRKMIENGERLKAHDRVLELSSEIGKFFEAVGITPEKQLFIETSANLTILEQKILADDKAASLKSMASLTANLAEFKQIIPEVASQTAIQLGEKMQALKQMIEISSRTTALDPASVELRTMFDELRSHVLMKEWFPETTEPNPEEKQ
ncbi:MAG: hypothetical protein ACOYXC_06360 [Candidatus Rifleibacteriota bacterium]